MGLNPAEAEAGRKLAQFIPVPAGVPPLPPAPSSWLSGAALSGALGASHCQMGVTDPFSAGKGGQRGSDASGPKPRHTALKKLPKTLKRKHSCFPSPNTREVHQSAGSMGAKSRAYVRAFGIQRDSCSGAELLSLWRCFIMSSGARWVGQGRRGERGGRLTACETLTETVVFTVEN